MSTATLSIDSALAAEGERQLNAVLARSATDRPFRTKLLTDPRAAFAEVLGRDIPLTFDLAFIENTVDATIVLPDPIDAASELTEGDLEAVAGGATPVSLAAVSTYLMLAAGGVLIGQVIGSVTHANH